MSSFGESKFLVIVLGAGAALLALALFVLFLMGDPSEREAPARLNDKLTTAEDSKEAPSEIEDPIPGEDAPSSAEERELLEAAEVEPDAHLFQGKVVEEGSRLPVERFWITVYQRALQDKEPLWMPHGVTVWVDEREGRFELERPVEEGFLYQVRVIASGYSRGASKELEAPPGRVSEEIVIALPPLPHISGMVLEADTLRPVEKALVYSATDASTEFNFDHDVSKILHAVADNMGKFTLRIESPETQILVARHPDYHDGIAAGVETGRDAEILMRPGLMIRGKALDMNGRPAKEAPILITGERGFGLPDLVHRVVTDEEGVFSSRKLAPGTYYVRLEELPGYTKESTFFGGETVRLQKEDVTWVELGGFPDKGSLVGTIPWSRSTRGLSRSEVIAVFSEREAELSKTAVFCCSGNGFSRYQAMLPEEEPWYLKKLAAPDKHGRFNLLFLDPGTYGFRIAIRGEAPFLPEYRGGEGEFMPPEYQQELIKPGECIRKTYKREPGCIQGCIVNLETGSPITGPGSFSILYRVGSTKTFLGKFIINYNGTFEFPYLSEGTYECVFSARGYGTKEVPVAIQKEEKKTLEVKLRPGGTVLADVQAPVPLSAWEITFGVPAETSWIILKGRDLKRDRAGRFILDRVGSGTVPLRCSCMATTLTQDVVVFKGGVSKATFSFVSSIAVSGHVIARGRPVTNARVVLKEEDETLHTALDCLYRPKKGEHLKYYRSSLDMGERDVFASPVYPNQEVEKGLYSMRAAFAARTDGNGFYALEVPKPGYYEVRLYSPCGNRMAVLGSKSFYITKGPLTLDLETSLYCIEARLVDFESRDPIPHARVSIRAEGDYRDARSDEEGRVVFNDLGASPVALYVDGPGYFPSTEVTAAVQPWLWGQKAGITIPVGEKGASLRLALTGWGVDLLDLRHISAAPRPIWRVASNHWPSPIPLSSFKQVNENTFLLRGLPPGRMNITVECSSRYSVYSRGRTEVELKQGEAVEAEVELKFTRK